MGGRLGLNDTGPVSTWNYDRQPLSVTLPVDPLSRPPEDRHGGEREGEAPAEPGVDA